MRFIIVLFLFIATGCNSTAQHSSLADANIFEKGLKDPSVQLLDVRSAGEFRRSHIKGSLHANWNDEEEFIKRTSALDKTKPVYVYCLSGPRSNAAAQYLKSTGFQEVVELKGGLLNWQKMNKPLEETAAIPQMTLEEYRQQLNDKEYALVDFGADWCPPCRKMEPVINQFLAQHKNVQLLKIDGGVHSQLMKQLRIDGIPTFLLLKNGKEMWRGNGIIPVEDLEAAFNTIK
jgi:rhodanese-related sulfurtransferase